MRTEPVELVSTASTVIDGVVDRSDVRRGFLRDLVESIVVRER